jgi:HlyD family secretion protein
MNKNKSLILAGAALLALLLIIYWRSGRGGGKTVYQTANPERRRITAKVTATGALSALVTVQVGSQVSGRIQSLGADFNSPVKKGQVIATIDPAMFDAAASQARANVSAAQGSLRKAEVQALDAQRQQQRAQALFMQKFVGQADLDTADANAHAAQAQVAVARGALEQARAAQHQAEINLAYTRILSPVDGVVISRSVDVGQTVAASLSAPTLFVIAEDLKKMQVDSSIAEADVGKLAPGMKTRFSVDAYPNERFRGVIRQIRNAPQTVQNVVTYDAIIDVDNSELKLKPGMTANVTIIYAEKEEALAIPNAALRFKPPDEGRRRGTGSGAGSSAASAPGEGRGRGPGASLGKAVWLLLNGKPEKREVSTGISDGSWTELTGGDLKEGDAVITDADGPARSAPAAAPPGGMRRMF